MTFPTIDISEGDKLRRNSSNGARYTWTEDIDNYAPGCLQMEADGNEADYDQLRLTDPVDA